MQLLWSDLKIGGGKGENHMYPGPTVLFCIRSLNPIENREIDFIIMPILMMKKLKLRESHLEVTEAGASPSSSDPKVHLQGGQAQVCFITNAPLHHPYQQMLFIAR